MTAALACQKTSQHQTSTVLPRTCVGNRATLPLPRSPSALSHIHSKTACRGFKSFCPCQKSQVSLLRCLTFSLVCGRIWQQGAPAGPPAVRVVGRWSPVATVQRRPRRQPRPSPSAPAKKPAKTLGFRRFPFFMCCIAIWCILVRISGFPTRPYRLHPSPAPGTHPVSPFSGFSGCVFSFSLLSGRKIFALVFVQPAA